MQAVFGAGIMWGTPVLDAYGVAAADTGPVLFGLLQDVSVDESSDVKMLYGQNTYPQYIARGKSKIDIKAKVAQICAELYNAIFYGQTVDVGLVSMHYETVGVAIPDTPYSITPSPPSSGAWDHDLGVISTNGTPMVKVASDATPATGQYKVSAGAYTFAEADKGDKVFINYAYTVTGSGHKQTVVNVPMGFAPKFQLDLMLPFQGKTKVLTFFNAIATKMTTATKLDDFAIPEVDISVFANPDGTVLQWSTTD